MFKSVDPKVNFSEEERRLLKKWYNEGIVDKYLHRNDKSTKKFSFFDGPITANNPMGVHHAWGRTYKDLWRRFKNMQGYKQLFQNGFDCQGLWVEVEVEKELGIKNKREIENLVTGNKKASIAKFVQLCKDRVMKFSQIQTEQSKRLGYFMNWENSYYTMSDENNYMIWHFLKVCYEKGWIYKGKDCVPWCPRCQTAISQHEMLTEDYKEIQHETVFIKFPIITEGWENTYLLIWTTTPWTVPANVAVAINTKYTYGVWEDGNGEKYIFLYTGEEGKEAKRSDKKKGELSLEQWIMQQSGKTLCNTGNNFKGGKLIGLRYKTPFDDLPIVQNLSRNNSKTFHKVIDGSKIVVDTEGTGLLHVAPGAGKEDFDLAKEEKLATISPIDDTATYIDTMGEFSGKNAKKHPELILDYLKNFNGGKFLFKSMHYTHRYPACWRCRTELVWKIADEWYISMDKPEKGKGKTLRQQMVETAKKIEWHPSFGLERELDWLKNMHDWLISKKNRYWGLALPIYECMKCRHFEVIGSKAELKDRSVSDWEKFESYSPHKPFIDEIKIKCEKCGEIVSRVDDVGNVWLDAGIIPFSTLVDPKSKQVSYLTDKKFWKKWFPADFITESFPGQFKNWFYSLIAMSTVLERTNSFKTVLGYASMLAEDGRPMHKSWGNSIEFNEGADKIGVDVMRWMYVTANPEQNLLFGYKKADETRRKFFLMLWNIYNFFITYANVDKWEPNIANFSTHASENILDKWIISKLHGTIKKVTENLEKYDSQRSSLAIEAFIENLSLWYVRRSRERVGPTAENEADKKNFYETTYAILITLSKLLAPFAPFISEEIYTNLTNEESVHLANWPNHTDTLIDPNLEKAMAQGREVASQILMKRKVTSIKVRIPLRKIEYSGPEKLTDEICSVVGQEVNVEKLSFTGKTAEFEIKTSDEDFIDPNNQDTFLGEAREIVRMIQEERKKLGTKLDARINVILVKWPTQHESYIKRNALITNLTKGESFKVKQI